jgi:energy-coupling factor transporter transmembrane protein EcfT
VLKAVAAGLAAVTVVLTTPYPQIFAPVQRVVPGIVGDALLMTYRTMFLLLGKFGDLVRAVRLRSGLRGTHPVRMARATTTALGSLLLYGLDLAQRDYDVMRLRGYSGRMRVHLPRSHNRVADAYVVAAGAAALATSVAWRLAWVALNPYSWLAPVAAAALLAATAVVRVARPTRSPQEA